jgi:hypothetical protein
VQPSQFISEYDLDHPLHWFRYHNGTEFIPPDFDSIPLAKHIDNSLAKWAQFQGDVQGGSDTLIIEGYPVLNSAGVFLWGDASRNECQAYLTQVRDLLEPAQPIIIYLRTSDVKAALQRKIELLKQKGLLPSFWESMNGQPYLHKRSLSGELGVFELWKSVQQALERFYQLDFNHCHISDRDRMNTKAVREIVVGKIFH